MSKCFVSAEPLSQFSDVLESTMFEEEKVEAKVQAKASNFVFKLSLRWRTVLGALISVVRAFSTEKAMPLCDTFICLFKINDRRTQGPLILLELHKYTQ